MLNKRDHRVTLGRDLFAVAGDLSDLELAYELRMSAAQISLCRAAAEAGKPIPVKRTRTVEMFIERRTAIGPTQVD